jgi:hypothetical protein
MQAKILQLLFKHSFRALTIKPEKAILKQAELWHYMVTYAKETEFGQVHHFENIQKLEDFKKLVPIQSYEDFEPTIERMLKGAQNLLWPDKISMFAKSSGTSNSKSKFIPLSKISLQENHFKGGRNILSIFCNSFPERNIFEGKNISVAGSFSSNDYGIIIGDLSALLLLNLPRWVQTKRLPSMSSALMLDWEAKIDKISNEICDENIGSLSGVPSWNLILLQNVLKKRGIKSLREIWPNFQLYMHGGVHFEPYRKAYQELIGNPSLVFLETYNASEGFFAIQDVFEVGENGMLLLCNHGVFYEFLRLAELGKKQAKTLQLNEIELGENYALIITTKSGLWRYLIGDTIRFINKNPFRIILSGRIKYFINIFGEELIEQNTNDAIKLVCSKLKCSIEEYTVGPIFPDKFGKGGHEWLIEFKEPPSELSIFIQELDKALKNVNSDYEAKRSGDLALQLPVVKILEQGAFFNWLKSRNKLGAQNKVPRLQNNRNVIEAVLSIAAH